MYDVYKYQFKNNIDIFEKKDQDDTFEFIKKKKCIFFSYNQPNLTDQFF